MIGTDFKFRDDLKFDTTPMEILIEQFKGIVFRFTEISFKEENGTGKLKFQYEIIDPADFSELKLRKSKEFETFLGLILNTLILETVDNESNNNRESDTQEFIKIN